jgi:hypothetical protein
MDWNNRWKEKSKSQNGDSNLAEETAVYGLNVELFPQGCLPSDT